MRIKFIILLLIVSVLFSPSSTASSQGNEGHPVYIVQSGDTMLGIASLFGTTLDELAQINNISDPNSIYPGLRLLIPGFTGVSGTITPIVVKVDEPWNDFLLKNQVDETSLVIMNDLLNPTAIYGGTRLLVPVAEDSPIYFAIDYTDYNRTLLEVSASQEMNPLTLLIQNRKKSSLDFYPNERVFSNRQNSQASHISPFITLLEVAPLPLTQGSTIQIQIDATEPLSITGEINGHILHFFSFDGLNYFALQGIHAMAEPGITELTINGSNNTGEKFTFDRYIYLIPGYFENDPPLKVAPEMIDPAYTNPELEKIRSLISVITPEKLWDGVFISPDTDYALEIPNYEEKKEITSFFGNRRTYNDDPVITFHTGIDFGGGSGLPIVASASGIVVFAGPLEIRGNATVIDHGLGVFSAYYHQTDIIVQVGDIVEKGQKIGTVGNTGRVDRANEYQGAGAHLHWEIWVNGVQVDPLEWLNNEYPILT